MSEEKLTSQKENFSEWYNQIVQRAELADYAPVRGCMVVPSPMAGPSGKISRLHWDKSFKETGHVNAAFPLLIPKSFLEKRKRTCRGILPGTGSCHNRRQ